MGPGTSNYLELPSSSHNKQYFTFFDDLNQPFFKGILGPIPRIFDMSLLSPLRADWIIESIHVWGSFYVYISWGIHFCVQIFPTLTTSNVSALRRNSAQPILQLISGKYVIGQTFSLVTSKQIELETPGCNQIVEDKKTSSDLTSPFNIDLKGAKL